MRNHWFFSLTLLWALAQGLLPATAETVTAGPYQIEIHLNPARVSPGSNQLQVTVQLQGKPAPGVRLFLHPQMLSMPMGGTNLTLNTDRNGRAQGSLKLGMAGSWRVDISLQGSAGKANASLPLTTGQEMGTGDAPNSARPSPSSTAGVDVNGIPAHTGGDPFPTSGVNPNQGARNGGNSLPPTVPPDSKAPNGGAPNRQGQAFPLPTPGSSGTQTDKATSTSMPGSALSLDSAVRMGLSTNPDLLSALQELGVANATVVQAKIISNPTLGGQFKFSNSSRFDDYWEASLTQNIMDFILRGARVDLAENQLEAARLRVMRVLFQQSTMIKTAYFRLQADQQDVILSQTMRDAADAAAELALRQRRAGNLSQLDVVRQQAVQMEAQSQLLEAQGRLAVDRQTLLRLLGQPGAAPQISFQAGMPPLPLDDPPLADLQRQALAHRQEIIAARLDQEVARRGEGLAGRFFGIDDVRLGISSSHEVEGVQITGPTLQFPLPIFNQNQGVRARYKAQGQVAQLSEQVALLNADYEVAQAYQKLQTARNMVKTSQEQIIPLRHQALELAKQQFNNMFLGIYGLLTIYREELDSRKRLVEVLADYWSARAELEKAVGIDLPAPKRGEL